MADNRYLLDAATVAKLAALYRDSQRDSVDYPVNDPPRAYASVGSFWGKIQAGSYTDHRYSVKAQLISNTGSATAAATYVDAGGDYSATVTATNLAEGITQSHLLPTGLIVRVMVEYDATTPTPQARFITSVTPPALIPLSLSQSGGSNGSSSSTASYTYNATNAITSVAIPGGPYSVTWARATGLVNVATHGTGYYASGSFTLFQADETPQVDNCS